MSKTGIRFFLLYMGLTLLSYSGNAQCAMCRASLENNVSNGDIGIAAGINFGILYLFAAPYVIIGIIAFFWYRASKNNRNELAKRGVAG